MVDRYIDQFDFIHWNDEWMSQDTEEDLEDEEDSEDE